MKTYNQHQVSEIKYSHISSIPNPPTTPTANITTNYRKEKSSFHSLEKNLAKIRHHFPPVLTSNNMWDNNKEKKNVCTNLLQLTEITEQKTITDKKHNSYTPFSSKKNLHIPQGPIKKLRTNILANNIPACKDPLRYITP